MKVALLGKIVFLLTLVSSVLFAAHFEVDPTHSQVSFKVKHMLISNVRGYFKNFSGSFDIVDSKITALQGVVKVVSVDTDSAKRDDHLKKVDFFHAVKYPEITFVMRENLGETIRGDLTIRGITKSIDLDVDFGGEADDPWGNHRAGIELRGEIDRNDFKVSYQSNGTLIANKVKLLIELEGIQKQ